MGLRHGPVPHFPTVSRLSSNRDAELYVMHNNYVLVSSLHHKSVLIRNTKPTRGTRPHPDRTTRQAPAS